MNKYINNNGVTLLEILIAITLMVSVLFAGGGFYLSGINLSENLSNFCQANRHAQIALMHIENVRYAASEFDIAGRDIDGDGINDAILRYKIFADASETEPSIICEYSFRTNSGRIICTPDISTPTDSVIVSEHIDDCVFRIMPTDGVVLHVEVTALDSNDNADNACTLSTDIEATQTASPSMFEV